MIFFDLDGTLTDNQDVWSKLYSRLKCCGEAIQLQEKYSQGPLEVWVEKAIELLSKKGMNERIRDEVLSGVNLRAGVYETLGKLRNNGKKLAILSGGLDFVLDKFDLKKYFDHVELNHTMFINEGDGVRFRRGILTPYGHGPYKARGLEDISARYGFIPQECVFVGNGKNDIYAFKRAGLSIGFNLDSPDLEQYCDYVVRNDDLREILPYIL